MRLRLVAGACALAIAPVATVGCSNVVECIEFAVTGTEVVLLQTAISSGDLTPDELDEAQAELDEALADVPEDAADELDVIADAFDEFINTADADGDGEVTEEEMDEASVVFDTPEVNQAFEDLGTWIEENCTLSS